MQVLLGYAFDRARDAAEIENMLRRVAEHYAMLWPPSTERHGTGDARVGLYMWDVIPSVWDWPSWQEDAGVSVATLHIPIGYERLIGDGLPAGAAIALGRALSEDPWRVREITPPFVLASLTAAQGRLRIHTDGVGLGRLFELRFAGGWVWSNRPAAACRFAGIRADADRDGWRTFAATGWFMGDRTPFAGVFAVPGGTTIGYDASGPGRTQSKVDCLASWAFRRPGDAVAPDRIDSIVDVLGRYYASLQRLSRVKFVADLSGGRDSRLVVAAALASGLELSVHTNGAAPGEAAVAEQLIAALPSAIAERVTHVVRRPEASCDDSEPTAPALTNALQWHRFQEGLRPATYLPRAAPESCRPASYVGMSGAAGELAHGHYYPADYADLGWLPGVERLDAFGAALAGTVVRTTGVATAGQQAARALVRRSLEAAYVRGIDDAKMLDYFYADERLRRWSIAGENSHRVAPLLVPDFIRAAFDLTPAQTRSSALHQAVIARLIPEWSEQPYHRRGKARVRAIGTSRIGSGLDRDAIAAMVGAPGDWRDVFDPEAVARSWGLLLDGRGGRADEALLQRVCWRAAFTDYLGELAGEKVEPRRARRPSRSPRRERTGGRIRRYTARGLRRAAHLLEPRS